MIVSLTVPSLGDYLHAKNLRHQLILSKDTDNQIILQFDWVRGTTDHTQPIVVASDPTFPL